MIYLEAYGDFVGKGSFNRVTEIDKDWVLKQPNPRKELEPEWKDIDIKGEFSRHISTMKKHPEIFARVKKLSYNRASIERLDTRKAQDETYYLVDWLKSNGYPTTSTTGVIDDNVLIGDLVDGYKPFDKILKMMLSSKDPVVKKWGEFVQKIKKVFPNGGLDIHIFNMGLDKDGIPKLLDF